MGNYVQLDDVGDGVEFVLPEKRIRIRYVIF